MIIGKVITQVGEIDQVATKLNAVDYWGAVKVRWLINRNNYKVEPGLYAVGSPNETSDVFVTANYKLSFDHLRKNLDSLNAWILVLDTKGVNVWCAAGKGTFGTAELIKRIKSTRLSEIISHNRLIVPQLGATGISAHQVKKLTTPGFVLDKTDAAPGCSCNVKPVFKQTRGFNVVFGPIRAADIKEFLKNGYRSTDEMRKVTFNFKDRLKLVPVDFVYASKRLLIACLIIFIISGLSRQGISFKQAYIEGLPSAIKIIAAYFTGILITPLILPYIPVRMFAYKGLISGLGLSLILLLFNVLGDNLFEKISWFLIIPAISSFMAMNFTGASTFTSLSGVKKEMKVFVPIQSVMAILGIALLITGKLIQ